MFEQLRIFFVGAGALSGVLIKGMERAELIGAQQVTVSNRRNEQRLNELKEQYNVQISRDKAQEIANADLIVLTPKPADAIAALEEIAPLLTPRHLLITCVAGIATNTLEACLTQPVPIIRAMPNTSSAVLESATAVCRGRWATAQHVELAMQLFNAIGTCVVVEEAHMDAVTGLSGSGPAYVYYIVEALMEAGRACGLPEDISKTLLLQTITGSAKMLAETGEHPSELRRQVTSPNGTTMAGIAVLDAHNVQRVFVETVRRATERAQEMGRQAQVKHITQTS